MQSNEIINSADLAEGEWDSDNGRQGLESDLVATHAAENRGIEFHVSMREYTMRDMEALIVKAAAQMLVGRHGNSALSKLIEERAIAIITQKADQAVAAIASDILDQPITPKYPFQKPDQPPVTMREFIGLTGREYLTAKVDNQGKPTTDSYYSKQRIQYLVEGFMERKFSDEIKKATSAAITEVQIALRAKHEAVLAAEKARIREALAKATGEAA